MTKYFTMILLAMMPIIIFAEEDPDELKWKQEVIKQHLSSPYYQKALDRGFKDYSYVYGLVDDFHESGEEALKSWMFLIDGECGRYYKAIQKVDKYVVYLGSKNMYNKCSWHARDRVVVIPVDGEDIKKNQYIDRKSYYIFLGVFDFKDSQGFSIKLPLLQQIKANKDPSKEKR